VAAPKIALRFRDVMPGVDTITEHKSILKKEGCVWWGWWKKDFEDDYSGLFASLPGDADVTIVIVDPSTERQYEARVRKWSLDETGSILSAYLLIIDRMPHKFMPGLS
jgi:hypothetical protein